MTKKSSQSVAGLPKNEIICNLNCIVIHCCIFLTQLCGVSILTSTVKLGEDWQTIFKASVAKKKKMKTRMSHIGDQIYCGMVFFVILITLVCLCKNLNLDLCIALCPHCQFQTLIKTLKLQSHVFVVEEETETKLYFRVMKWCLTAFDVHWDDLFCFFICWQLLEHLHWQTF